jgi:hypothetical protein
LIGRGGRQGLRSVGVLRFPVTQLALAARHARASPLRPTVRRVGSFGTLVSEARATGEDRRVVAVALVVREAHVAVGTFAARDFPGAFAPSLPSRQLRSVWLLGAATAVGAGTVSAAVALRRRRQLLGSRLALDTQRRHPLGDGSDQRPPAGQGLRELVG